MHFRTFRLLIWVVFISSSTWCQNYHFEAFSIEEGLPQSEIMAMHQDSQGYIWFGTNGGGVCRFDGQNFTTYTTSVGLTNNQVWAIEEDRQGRLWFGTFGGGMSVFDGRGFKNFNSNSGYTNDEIRCIHEDKSGRIWIGTNGSGIKMFDGISFFHFTAQNGLSSNIILSFLEAEDGTLWVGTESGLCRNNGNSFECYTLRETPTDPKVETMLELESGNILLGTWADGILKFQDLEFSEAKFYDVLEGLTIWTMLFDSHGNLWVGTEGQGLFKFDGKRYIKYDIENGLNSNTIYSLLEDREGNIWVGTDRGGVFRYSGDHLVNFLHRSAAVTSFLEDTADFIWSGTQNGLTRYQWDDSRENYEKVPLPAGFERLDTVSVLDLFQASDGSIYVATDMEGVFHWSNEKLEQYNSPPDLSSPIVYSIAEDDLGNIWFGTDWGLTVYDGISFDRRPSKLDSIRPSRFIVYDLLKVQNDEIWMATDYGVIIGRNNKFKEFEEVPLIKECRINSMEFDELTQTIFFATYGKGLVIYDLQSGRYQVLSTESGLASNMLRSVMKDPYGSLWLGSIKGVDVIENWTDPDKRRILHFDRKNGFVGTECFQDAILFDKHGGVWLGMSQGASRYVKSKHKKSEVKPLIIINQVELFFKPIKEYGQDQITDPFTNIPDYITFDYDQNHLTFDFQGIYFSSSEKLKYSYWLEGVDDGWSPLTDVSSATFSNISPGDYAFHVTACTQEGICVEEAATMKFTILPPFWKTWWFRSGLLLLILGLIYLFFKIRVLTYNKDVVRELIKAITLKVKGKQYVYIKVVQGHQARIELDNILWIKSSGDYVDIFTSNKKYVVRSTLTAMMKVLDKEKLFVQVHRSYVVSMDQVELIKTNSLTINATDIPIGKTYQKKLKELWEAMSFKSAKKG
ncbi:LytTR family transcriptional regulator DNA-binding domain-containing protein [Crocinitomix catalasitica]|nr:LytTR family transcriptional regulator DNA-binding domain-containing protein [Crocinitomix catalasitica]